MIERHAKRAGIKTKVFGHLRQTARHFGCRRPPGGRWGNPRINLEGSVRTMVIPGSLCAPPPVVVTVPIAEDGQRSEHNQHIFLAIFATLAVFGGTAEQVF